MSSDIKHAGMLRVMLFEPWFLGWSRWSVELDDGPIRWELAKGRWLWRGRQAKLMEISSGMAKAAMWRPV